MVPRIGSQGRSFKGAALYYLHDKKAGTDERVAFTHTENLPTDEPEMAWRFMACTSMDAARLKREAGVAPTGRKPRPVFTMSLSWHPDEEPEQEHMIGAMRGALAALGLQDRQTLMVSHSDRDHPHLHAIVNLTDPETGRIANLDYSKEKLSAWALEYEKQHGIRCHERVENNRRRDREKERRGGKQKDADKVKADYPRHKEKKLEQAEEINRLYHTTRTAGQFQTGLKNLGFRLAQGNRVLLIDPRGNRYSLSRQIDGVKAKDIRKKLEGLELRDADTVRGEVMDARRRDRRDEDRLRVSQIAVGLDRSRQRIAARLRAVDEQLEKDYGEGERSLRSEIRDLEGELDQPGLPGRTWRRLTGKEKRLRQDLEDKKRNLQNLEWRKEERRGTLAKLLEQRSATAAKFQERLKELRRQPETEKLRQQTERQAAKTAEPVKAQAPPQRQRQAANENRSLPKVERQPPPKAPEPVRTPPPPSPAPMKPPPAPVVDFEQAAREAQARRDAHQAQKEEIYRQAQQQRERDTGPTRER
jgi:hypothetical protein